MDLKYATIDAAIRLSHCHFDGVPDLYGAQLRQLNLSKSVLPGLTSATLRVDGVLRMTDCRMRGPVRLAGALFMERAEFTAPDDSEPVLQLNQAAIGDDLWAPEMRAHGQVRLTGASVAGRINVQDAEFNKPDGAALDAQNLNVGAHVRARCVRAQGRVELRGSRISGRLDLLHAHLSHPGDTALRASSCVIGELWLRRGDRIEGALNLRRSQIEILTLEPEMLPEHVYLSNLTYTALTPHEPAERRLPMLERDGERYEPHGYEQLTAAYHHVGDDDAARLVQLAKQRRSDAPRSPGTDGCGGTSRTPPSATASAHCARPSGCCPLWRSDRSCMAWTTHAPSRRARPLTSTPSSTPSTCSCRSSASAKSQRSPLRAGTSGCRTP